MEAYTNCHFGEEMANDFHLQIHKIQGYLCAANAFSFQ